MPGYDELEWRDFKDFTGGLWERGNDRECAPNGLLESTDCFPIPAGGLKAFAAFDPIVSVFTTDNGMTWSHDPLWALGIWYLPQSTLGGGDDLYCMIMQGSTAPFTFALLRLDTDSNGPISEADLLETRWQFGRFRTDITTIQGALKMVTFRSVAPAKEVAAYFNHPIKTTSVGSTLGGGIYRTESTGAASFVFGNPVSSADELFRGLWTHQGRLVSIAVDETPNDYMHIVYTDPGSISAPTTANIIAPLGESPTGLSVVEPFPPSDLFFMKDGLAYGTIQGNIATPTVRAQGYTHLRPRGWPVKTDLGLVMVIANEGAYVWTGEGLEPLSFAIRGDAMGGTPFNSETGHLLETTEDGCDLRGAPDWSGVSGDDVARAHCSGQLGAYENWVFFNNGYMLDARTGAWFKQTSVPGARWWATDMRNRRMYVSVNTPFSRGTQTGSNAPAARPHPFYWSRMGEDSWTPMHTYSFTLPLIESPGQRTNLRELEYEVTSYNDASQLTVEINTGSGLSDTLGPFSLADSRPDTVRILVPGHPEDWYKVRTILTSNRPGTAAPTLTKMRVGTQASLRNPVNR